MLLRPSLAPVAKVVQDLSLAGSITIEGYCSMALQSTPSWGQLRPNRAQRLVIDAIHARILRGIFRRLARKALIVSGPSYDIEIDGVRLRCRLGDNSTEYAILEYGPTAHRLGLPQVLAALRPGDVFVDAGANCGVFTAFAGKAVGPSGRVIAIEPQPEMLARLKFNVSANDLSNVTVFATALGDVAGTLAMHIKPHNLGATWDDGASDAKEARMWVSLPRGLRQ